MLFGFVCCVTVSQVVLVKLQKTRELYRLPSAEELAPLVIAAGDPSAVDTVNGRIGDICVMLVCMMVGTRWQGGVARAIVGWLRYQTLLW
jgi:hypothetical protein